MRKLTLGEIVEASARAALTLQRQDGAFEGGHNGPYDDPETPVRNTAHWLFTFLRCFQWTGDQRFRAAAVAALGYLKSRDARPMGASFWIRRNPDRDFCNGLVGQAWIIESLVEAARVLDDDESLRIAREVFSLHAFDDRHAAWRSLGVDGSRLAHDSTPNHQLWFAAAGAWLVKHGYRESEAPIDAFLKRLPSRIWQRKDGLIFHRWPLFLQSTRRGKAVAIIRMNLPRHRRRQLDQKSIGYHAFNTYALGMLKEALGAHSVLDSRAVHRAIDYLGSASYEHDIESAPYAIEYNPPGIEAAYSISTLAPGLNTSARASAWLQWQFKHTFDQTAHLMHNRAADPRTSAARIYEATRLDPSIEIDVP